VPFPSFLVIIILALIPLYAAASARPGPLSPEERASRWVADVDGDCIFESPPITREQFAAKWPEVDLEAIAANESLGIGLEDGFVVSTRPNYRMLCGPEAAPAQALAVMAAVAGLVLLYLFFVNK
jgi:hypothetical protein